MMLHYRNYIANVVIEAQPTREQECAQQWDVYRLVLSLSL